jgi:hypothetical protein
VVSSDRELRIWDGYFHELHNEPEDERNETTKYIASGFLLGVGIRVCPRRDCKVSGCIFGVAGELDDILMWRLIDLRGSTRDGMNSNSVWLRCYIHAVKFIIRHSQCRYPNITRSYYSLLERCDFK